MLRQHSRRPSDTDQASLVFCTQDVATNLSNLYTDIEHWRTILNNLHTASMRPGKTWFLSARVDDSPLDLLIDPGACVFSISRKCYEDMSLHCGTKLTLGKYVRRDRGSQQALHNYLWYVHLPTGHSTDIIHS